MNDRSRSIKSYDVKSSDFEQLINFDSEDTPFLSNLSVKLTNLAPLLASKRAPNLADPKKESGSSLPISQRNTQNQERKFSSNLGNSSIGDANSLFSSDRFSIEKTNEGKSIPKKNLVETLILSGGVVKGIAYPGVVRALEEKGHLLTVRDIYAASAGAIAGAILAAGTTSQEFKELSAGINLTDLISKSLIQKQKIEHENSSTKNKAPKDTWFNTIKTVVPNIGTTAPTLERFIDDTTRDTIKAHIEKRKVKNENELEIEIEDIYKKLNEIEIKTNKVGSVTFRDLEILNKYIPEIKKFHCTATATFGSDEPQLVVLNASTFPDLAISKAACASGALPILFKKARLDNEDFGNNATYADGGLLLNTPVPFLINGNKDASNYLIFSFEDHLLDKAMHGKLPHNGNIMQSLSEKMTGVRYKTKRKYLYSQLAKPFLSERIIILSLKNVGKKIKTTLARKGD